MYAFFCYFFMVLRIIILSFTCTSIISALKNQSQIIEHPDLGDFTLRLASKNDIPDLLGHFSKIVVNAEDCKKLCISAQVLSDKYHASFLIFLTDNIKQKKLFVAVKEGAIVAFVRLYIMNLRESVEILNHRIRCFGVPLEGPLLIQHDRQLWLHLDLQYTTPALRRHQLGLELLEYAFNCLDDDCFGCQAEGKEDSDGDFEKKIEDLRKALEDEALFEKQLDCCTKILINEHPTVTSINLVYRKVVGEENAKLPGLAFKNFINQRFNNESGTLASFDISVFETKMRTSEDARGIVLSYRLQ